mgnify:CR=1 FL=1
MPSFWTSEDTRNALLATVIPGGTAILGAAIYSTDQAAMQWWGALKKPSWLGENAMRAISGIDILVGTPLGYASYLCYKHGGGFDYNDTRLALALYGLNMASCAACIPLVKKGNLNCLYRNMFIVSATAVATTVAFYKIHKPSGYWMIPYALWTGFYLFLLDAVRKENSPVKDL